jgi:lysophospholipase L1-like esterase
MPSYFDEQSGRFSTLTLAALREAMWETAQAAVAPIGRDRLAAEVAASVVKPLGPRLAVTGDSIALGGATPNTTPIHYYNGNAEITLFASLYSDGRVRCVDNRGVNGENSTQVLARFASDLASMDPPPHAIYIYAGTNDSNTDRTALTRQNIIAMVTMARSLGIAPILGTLVPSNARDSATKASVDAFNAWLLLYGAANNILVLDVYREGVDPTTGDWKSGWSTDGLHPNPTVSGPAIGMAVADQLAAYFPSVGLPLQATNNQGANLLLNGCMAGAGPVADSWSGTGNNLGTKTYSVSTDTDALGQWQNLEASGAAAWNWSISQTVAAGAATFAVGDRLLFAGRARATLGAGVALTVNVYGGATFRAYLSNNIQAPELAPFTFAYEFVVAEGVTSLAPGVTIVATSGAGGSGSVGLAQATLLNLTALGLV